MKLIAAISAFLFIPLAAMFGTSLGQSQPDLVSTMLLTLLFVAGTSLVLGVVFGRTALRTTTICGGLALFVMWLPFQYYATEESLIRSAIALLLIIFAQMPMSTLTKTYSMVNGCLLTKKSHTTPATSRNCAC